MSEPMDINFSLFNSHKNEALKRATDLMRLIHPKMMDRVDQITKEQGGVMGVFSAQPEPATMVFVGMVTAFVNEDHVPKGEDDREASQ